jgi:hypothetical protein
VKSSSAALRSVLYDFQDFILADLVTLHFPSGVQRFTNSKANITVGGNTYLSAHIEAPGLVQGLGSESETFQLVFAVGGQTVAGISFLAAALAGLFDRVRVEVALAATRTTFAGYSAADLAISFDGLCTKADPQPGSALMLQVQGPVSLGKVPTSNRVVAATCPFSLGDVDCGVALASFRDARTVAAGSTAAVVRLSSSSARAVTGSVLAITSGNWSGQSRVIRSVSGVDCTLDVPLPGIEIGASLTVANADDKKRATCVGTFANGARFGGFPEAPVERR